MQTDRLSTTWLIVIEVTLLFEVLKNSKRGVCICIADNGSAVVDDVSLPKRMCVLRIDLLFYGKWVLFSNYNTNTNPITYPASFNENCKAKQFAMLILHYCELAILAQANFDISNV